MRQQRSHRFAAILVGLLVACGPAAAEINVSPVIVDFDAPNVRRADVQVENTGTEQVYVVVEPSEVVNPGTKTEQRRSDPDPEKLGLLVTPVRFVMEAGEQRIVRVALLRDAAAVDRIFRVTIKPVVGKISAPTNAIKVLVAYDVLVMQRPKDVQLNIIGERQGRFLVLRNNGNTNALLYDGKQCEANGKNCRPLEAKRIYAGGEWRVALPGQGQATYVVQIGNRVTRQNF